jgi:hypothetical protein
MLSNAAKDAKTTVCRVPLVLQFLYANVPLKVLLVLRLDKPRCVTLIILCFHPNVLLQLLSPHPRFAALHGYGGRGRRG